MSRLSDSVIACACMTQNVDREALRFRSMHKGWEASRWTRRVMKYEGCSSIYCTVILTGRDGLPVDSGEVAEVWPVLELGRALGQQVL